MKYKQLPHMSKLGSRNEPEWYNEKKPVNRLDSALEDVTETMESDIFGFGAGGLFDAEPAKSSFTEPVRLFSTFNICWTWTLHYKSE